MTTSALDGVFGPEALLRQLPFLLLVLGVLAASERRGRSLIATGAVVGVAHALLIAHDVILAFWWGLLLFAVLVALAGALFKGGRGGFSTDEEAMMTGILAGLPRPRARHLLDQGFWLAGRSGDVLTRETEPVPNLYFLAAGEARVISHGREVGLCRAGDLIGEVTVLSGEAASATVVLSGPARLWCAPANVLRPYLKAHPEVRHALEEGFAVSLKAKLRSSNDRMVEMSEAAA